MAEHALQAMAQGGLFDVIGGGFARYSTDIRWLIPHFEKMLYDNGQLLSLYAEAYALEPNERFKEIIDLTVAFIQREITSTEGAFYCGLDADSEGLLLLTSEGRLQQRLTDPRFGHWRTYWVQVEGEATGEQLSQLREGVTVQGQRTLPGGKL